ncbi:hypothetical protein BDV96DRAFT_640474 [Lophiotrema nucula]|uniref:Uncharacterized protein n=1 Tax=Lophiotrema nucula TaxID=690887 RepID=A0A6A5ZS40_9PLEO|nr:hypothetical protein BDV96DRAFT_640474 [Lophiotrema nucula]
MKANDRKLVRDEDPAKVEATARLIFIILIERCITGYTGPASKDERRKEDQAVNCLDRFYRIVYTLKIWKAVCRDCIHDDSKIIELVHQPITTIRQKQAQKDTNQKRKNDKEHTAKAASVQSNTPSAFHFGGRSGGGYYHSQTQPINLSTPGSRHLNTQEGSNHETFDGTLDMADHKDFGGPLAGAPGTQRNNVVFATDNGHSSIMYNSRYSGVDNEGLVAATGNPYGSTIRGHNRTSGPAESIFGADSSSGRINTRIAGLKEPKSAHDLHGPTIMGYGDPSDLSLHHEDRAPENEKPA